MCVAKTHRTLLKGSYLIRQILRKCAMKLRQAVHINHVASRNVFFFFQIAKIRNLPALLTRSENAVLGNIFTSLWCNYDTKQTCKRSFWLTKLSFSESNEHMSKVSAEIMAILFFYSRASFSLIFENSSISVLKINYRYLQSRGLKSFIGIWLLCLSDAVSELTRWKLAIASITPALAAIM